MAAAGKGDVSVRVHKAREGAMAPVLVNFVQGPPGEGCLSGAGDDAGAQFQPLQFTLAQLAATDGGEVTGRKRAQRMLTAANETLTFEARHTGVGDAAKACTYSIGVYNAKRRRLEVFPVESNTIFGMQLTKIRSQNAATGPVTGGLEGLTRLERRDMVIQDFGSRKKKKMEQSRKANIVDIEAVAAIDDVATTLRDTSAAAVAAGTISRPAEAEPSGEGDAAAAGAKKPAVMSTSQAKVEATIMEARMATLPPFNLSAAAPAAAYPLNQLVPASIMSALEAAASAIVSALSTAEGGLDTVVIQNGRGSDYVKNKLRYILKPLAAGAGAGAAEEGEAAEEGGSSKKFSKAHVAKRLRPLVYLKHLVALYQSPTELRFREIKPKAPAAGAGASADGEEAGAAAAAAAAAPAESAAEAAIASAGMDVDAPAARVAIPSLRFMPDEVVISLLTAFTEAHVDNMGGSHDGMVYQRTPAMVDKLTAHICALTLHLDNFDLDMAVIARDLKQPPGKLMNMYKELGCVVTPVKEDAALAKTQSAAARAASGSYRAKLTVPLTFPKLKLGRKK